MIDPKDRDSVESWVIGPILESCLEPYFSSLAVAEQPRMTNYPSIPVYSILLKLMLCWTRQPQDSLNSSVLTHTF